MQEKTKEIATIKQTVRLQQWAEQVQEQLLLDPFSSALFLFCGRRRNRIKGFL